MIQYSKIMMRRIITALRKSVGRILLDRDHLNGSRHVCEAVNQKTFGVLIKQQYNAEKKPIQLTDVGFRVYSQHEEDGILLYIFALIGTTNKRCVEICAGDGIECNTANLIINHRWIGLLFDGNKSNTDKARSFYCNHPDTKYWPPVVINAWITRENINALIQENGFGGEIDLLSLDVDGVDYWIWKAISIVQPRVLVVEINHLWGPERSMTVPYREDFVAEFTAYGSDYGGASLAAFVKLSKSKGYRLVGTNAIATNAFFVRDDICCDWLPEIDPSQCFDHPRARFGMGHRLPNVIGKEWVEI
jgi:hypothetical protein